MGVSAEQFQKLEYAAGMSGVSVGTLESAAKKLQASGSQLSLDEALLQIASIGDESERAAAAEELFGKGAYELTPLLNAGAEGIQGLMDQASQYGMVMSNDAVAAGAAFGDSLAMLTQTVEGMKNNLLANLFEPLTTIMGGITDLIAGVDGAQEKISAGVQQLVSNVSKELPKILDAMAGILMGLLEAITANLPLLMEQGVQIVMQMVTGIVTMLPDILDAAVECIITLCNGLTDSLPELIPVMVDAILTMVQGLLDNLPEIINCALELILALAQGLIDAIPKIIERLPEIISSLVDGLIAMIGDLVSAGIDLIIALAKGLIDAIPQLIAKIPEIITSIVNKLKDGDALGKIADAGLKLIEGLWNGIKNSITWIKNKIREWVGNVLSFIKGLFGIHSPSKVFAGYGEYLVEGLGEGIIDNTSAATDAMEEMATEVEEAFNPQLDFSVEPEDFKAQNLGTVGAFDYNVNQTINQDKNDWWIDRLVEKLIAATDKEIVLNVDGKAFAQTSINTINDYTRQTGKLALNLI